MDCTGSDSFPLCTAIKDNHACACYTLDGIIKNWVILSDEAYDGLIPKTHPWKKLRKKLREEKKKNGKESFMIWRKDKALKNELQ